MAFKEIKDFFLNKKKGKPLYAKNIHFSYNNDEILKNLNLSIKSSKIIAIIGKSGSGKSTFLKIVSGVLTSKYKGKIKVFGANKDFSKDNLGYVPQDISLIPELSIKENILFFGNLNGLTSPQALKKGKELLKLLQIKASIEKTPLELSGGQRVRLNIIVSLLHDPDILILDEPFVGLDYANRMILWYFLVYLKNRHKTIILTTHMLTEAENFADNIIIIHLGNILAKGKLDDIKDKLNVEYVYEIKFPKLTKTNKNIIDSYIATHEISLISSFNNFYLLSMKRLGQKNYFVKFLDKERINYEEIEFRVPNLDEILLKVKTE